MHLNNFDLRTLYTRTIAKELLSIDLALGNLPSIIEKSIQHLCQLLVQFELKSFRLDEEDCTPDQCNCTQASVIDERTLKMEFVISFFGSAMSSYWYCPMRMTITRLDSEECEMSYQIGKMRAGTLERNSTPEEAKAIILDGMYCIERETVI